MKKIREIVYSLGIDEAKQEALLEALRLAVLVGASTLVGVLLEALTGATQSVLVMFLVVLGRIADKWLYEQQKLSRDKRTKETPTGLIGF